MTPKYIPILEGPPPKKKYRQYLQIYFSENPTKIEIQNFEPQKNDPSLRMFENIRVPPSGALKKKRCQSWTPTDKTFWIRACLFLLLANNVHVGWSVNLLSLYASFLVIFLRSVVV